MKIQIDDEIRNATKTEIDDYNKVSEHLAAQTAAMSQRIEALQSACNKLAALGLNDSEIEALLGVSRG